MEERGAGAVEVEGGDTGLGASSELPQSLGFYLENTFSDYLSHS